MPRSRRRPLLVGSERGRPGLPGYVGWKLARVVFGSTRLPNGANKTVLVFGLHGVGEPEGHRCSRFRSRRSARRRLSLSWKDQVGVMQS